MERRPTAENCIPRMLALFVSNLMGGTQIDDVAAPNEIVKLADQVIHYVKEVLQSNVVLIVPFCRISRCSLFSIHQMGCRCLWDA